jgi:hypothetical protein
MSRDGDDREDSPVRDGDDGMADKEERGEHRGEERDREDRSDRDRDEVRDEGVSERDRDARERYSKGGENEPTCSLLVRNLSFRVRAEEIRRMCER